jgi:hypothetical protein
VRSTTFADIDESLLWSFVREFEGDAFDEASANGYPTRSVLGRDLLLTAAVGGDEVPSVAGLLLFGRDERVQELLPRSRVVATRFAGATVQAPVIERVELGGNLLTLYEATHRFLARYCDLWETRPRKLPESGVVESPVPARGNYPEAAVHEAVANMLAHRDLALRDQPIRLHIFDRAFGVQQSASLSGFLPGGPKGHSLWGAAAVESSVECDLQESGIWAKGSAGRVAGPAARHAALREQTR